MIEVRVITLIDGVKDVSLHEVKNYGFDKNGFLVLTYPDNSQILLHKRVIMTISVKREG